MPRPLYASRGLITARSNSGHAADPGAAEPTIAIRIFGEVLLVVVLGVKEFGRETDVGGDGTKTTRLQTGLIT